MGNRINYKGFFIDRLYQISDSENTFYVNEFSLKKAKEAIDKRLKELKK